MRDRAKRPFEGAWPSADVLRSEELRVIEKAIDDWWDTWDPRPSLGGAIAGALDAHRLLAVKGAVAERVEQLAAANPAVAAGRVDVERLADELGADIVEPAEAAAERGAIPFDPSGFGGPPFDASGFEAYP